MAHTTSYNVSCDPNLLHLLYNDTEYARQLNKLFVLMNSFNSLRLQSGVQIPSSLPGFSFPDSVGIYPDGHSISYI